MVGELVRDIRKLMGPYTATNLREKRYILNNMFGNERFPHPVFVVVVTTE